jgi:hypothetical protein
VRAAEFQDRPAMKRPTEGAVSEDDPTRRALTDELAAVETEFAGVKKALHAEYKTLTAPKATATERTSLKNKQRQLDQLKRRAQKIREQLCKHRQDKDHAFRVKQHRREELFIDLARKRLGEETFRELWAEVDRLEQLQWQAVWSAPA